MENPQDYVTQLEFERKQNEMRQTLNKKITAVDDKVDNLRDIVLPMAESSKQTAENTKEIATTMKTFTEEQRKVNGKFYERHHEHEVAFTEIKGQFAEVGVKLAARTEAKGNNTKLWLGVIALMSAGITGIFQVAPALLNFFSGGGN